MKTKTDREKLIDFIDKFGIKKSHVAKQIGCSPSELSHFLSKKRGLRIECQERLSKYVNA